VVVHRTYWAALGGGYTSAGTTGPITEKPFRGFSDLRWVCWVISLHPQGSQATDLPTESVCKQVEKMAWVAPSACNGSIASLCFPAAWVAVGYREGTKSNYFLPLKRRKKTHTHTQTIKTSNTFH